MTRKERINQLDELIDRLGWRMYELSKCFRCDEDNDERKEYYRVKAQRDEAWSYRSKLLQGIIYKG